MKITGTHTAYAAIFVLIAALTFQSYRLSNKMSKLNEVNNELALAKINISQKQDSINLLSGQASSLQGRADSLGLLAIELQKSNKVLHGKLDSALAKIDSIPAGATYLYLRDTIYNYPGELKYPFNAKQITEMRKTYVGKVMLEKINVNQAITIEILTKQNSIQDSLINNQYVQLNLYADMVKSLKGVVATQTDQNNKLSKQLSNQKKIRYIFQGISVAETIYILISLL